jgi:hypothetical protein
MTGTKADPWRLHTPPGTSEHPMHHDADAEPPQLVCQVGSTRLAYDARCIDDAVAMLKARGDWMTLGAAELDHNARNNRVRAL